MGCDINNAQFLFMKLKRFTKQQVIEFAKKNPANSNYAFSERSGKYIVSVPKKKK